MKEKLKGARIELAFFALTVAFLAVFFFVDFGAEKDVFPSFSVAVTGAAEKKTEEIRTVNINAASCEELETLPGVGEKLAGKIVLWRQENGPFTQKEDLLLVDGLSEKIYYELVDHITLRASAR